MEASGVSESLDLRIDVERVTKLFYQIRTEVLMRSVKHYGPLLKEVLFWSVVVATAILMLPIILLWSLKAWVELG
jgi:hypothetical protein